MNGLCSQLAASLVAVLISLTSAAEVKETVRLVITGGTLHEAVTAEDAELLAESNVYRGTFIGTLATEPERSWPRFLVVFDVQTLRGVKSHAYAVYYTTNEATGDAFVYLPGEHDALYRSNISTILRDGRDGHWHSASPSWARALDAAIGRVEASRGLAQPPRP